MKKVVIMQAVATLVFAVVYLGCRYTGLPQSGALIVTSALIVTVGALAVFLGGEFVMVKGSIEDLIINLIVFLAGCSGVLCMQGSISFFVFIPLIILLLGFFLKERPWWWGVGYVFEGLVAALAVLYAAHNVH